MLSSLCSESQSLEGYLGFLLSLRLRPDLAQSGAQVTPLPQRVLVGTQRQGAGESPAGPTADDSMVTPVASLSVPSPPVHITGHVGEVSARPALQGDGGTHGPCFLSVHHLQPPSYKVVVDGSCAHLLLR